MKKFIFLAILFIFLFIPQSHAAGLLLEGIEGQVEVLKKGSAAWVSAQEGLPIEAGDKIKTGKKSKVRIQMEKGTVDLGENTEFGVKEHVVTQDQIKTSLELTLGKLKAKVVKLKQGSQFEIRTPTSVASVRGTFFFLWVYEYLGSFFTRLDVEEGIVNFADLEGEESYDVEEDQYSTGGEEGVTEPKSGGGGEEEGKEQGTGDYDSGEGYQQDTDGSQENAQGSPVPPEEPPSEEKEEKSTRIRNGGQDCTGQKC